jgi:lysophospholipase L1-like esterase
MLGTNDAANIYNLTAQDIANHLEQTIGLVQGEKIYKILIVCPPDIISDAEDMDPKYANSSEIIKKLPELFKKVAEKYNCNFINAQDYILSSKLDGVHFDSNSHKKLAEIFKIEILKMLK